MNKPSFSQRCRVLLAATLLVNASLPTVSADNFERTRLFEIIVAPISDSNDFLAYNTKTGRGQEYTFAKETKPIPVANEAIAAFSLKGDKINELVAVDRQGTWRPLKLPKSTAKECVPIVSDRLAVYYVDGHVHAFSGITGTWGTISCASSQRLAVGDYTAIVITADSRTIFNADAGTWEVAHTTSNKR